MEKVKPVVMAKRDFKWSGISKLVALFGNLGVSVIWIMTQKLKFNISLLYSPA